jgi:hypothetical protein
MVTFAYDVTSPEAAFNASLAKIQAEARRRQQLRAANDGHGRCARSPLHLSVSHPPGLPPSRPPGLPAPTTTTTISLL